MRECWGIIFPIRCKRRFTNCFSKILEAMCLKIPVIAYGVGGIPEVLKNGEPSWCIPPNDQNGFESALEEVMALDAKSKETILSNARKLVLSDHTLQKVTLQFEDFYKRLLDSPTGVFFKLSQFG
ncbi:MAG: hypothetical protein C0433_01515 [Cyclobacterium sp.]|nr:hypothetical protein [Cyclobacterium sp.]